MQLSRLSHLPHSAPDSFSLHTFLFGGVLSASRSSLSDMVSTSSHFGRSLSRRSSNRAGSGNSNVHPTLALVVPPSSARSSIRRSASLNHPGTTTTDKTGPSLVCCGRDENGEFAAVKVTGRMERTVITNPPRVSRIPSQFTPSQSISHLSRANSARNNLSPGYGLSPSFRASVAGSNMSGPYSAVSELENTQRPVETRGNPVSECPGNHSPHPNRPRSLTAPSPSVEFISLHQKPQTPAVGDRAILFGIGNRIIRIRPTLRDSDDIQQTGLLRPTELTPMAPSHDQPMACDTRTLTTSP